MLVQPIRCVVGIHKRFARGFLYSLLDAVPIEQGQAHFPIKAALELDALKICWVPLNRQTPFLRDHEIIVHEGA
jgi:hypothetical protein